MFNVRSYDLIKDYSFGTERSTGIKDYHLKGCMEGQSLMLMTSGRKRRLKAKVATSTEFCELHLLLCDGKLIMAMMITEGKKQKRQSQINPAFSGLWLNIDLVFPPSPEPDNTHHGNTK